MQTLQLKIAQNSVAYVRLAANGNDPDTIVEYAWVGLGYGLVCSGLVWVQFGFGVGYAGRMVVPATFVLV